MSQPLSTPAAGTAAHIPVLLPEVLDALKPGNGEIFVDCTFGAGGYGSAVLKTADCRLIGLDRDPDAIAAGQVLVDAFGGRLSLVETSFDLLEDVLAERGISQVDGVVMDIGVSSMQLDQAARGFSFLRDGPLDMRMAQQGLSAADVVADFSAENLADIIYVLGEETKSRAIARAIVQARAQAAILTTHELVKAIERATGPHRPHLRTHPATRTFQALRIFVNDELRQLNDALLAAERVLKPGGRLVVVTFHSLEDRLVKQFFATRSGHVPSVSRHVPLADVKVLPSFELPYKHHVTATEAELAANPRARSAKLRWGTRTEHAAMTANIKNAETFFSERFY